MSKPPSSDKVSDDVHPLVHKAAAALLIWFVVAAWLLFDAGGYAKLALAMVSVLVFMVIGIGGALLRANTVAQRNAEQSAGEGTGPEHAIHATEVADTETLAAKETPETLGCWMRGQFSTWTGRENGLTAAVEILLPLAAVAFGLTALGIVFELTRSSMG